MHPLTIADSLLRTVLFLLQLATAAYALWFGLYVIGRVRLFAEADWQARRPGTYRRPRTRCMGRSSTDRTAHIHRIRGNCCILRFRLSS